MPARWVENKTYGDEGKNQLWQKPFNYCRDRWSPSGGWVGISLSLRAHDPFVEIPSPAVTMLGLDVGLYTDAHPRVQSIVEVSPDSRNRHGSWIVPWPSGVPVHTANRTAYVGVYAVNVAQRWAEGGQAFTVRVHPPGDYIRLSEFPWPPTIL